MSASADLPNRPGRAAAYDGGSAEGCGRNVAVYPSKKTARPRAVNRETAAESSGNPHVIDAVTGSAHVIDAGDGRAEQRVWCSLGVERLPFVTACRVEGGADGADALVWPTRDAPRTEDRCGRLVALFASDWARRYAEEQNPQATLPAIA